MLSLVQIAEWQYWNYRSVCDSSNISCSCFSLTITLEVKSEGKSLWHFMHFWLKSSNPVSVAPHAHCVQYDQVELNFKEVKEQLEMTCLKSH